MLDSIMPTAPSLSISGSNAATGASQAGSASALARAGGDVVATTGSEDFSTVLERLVNDAIGTLKTAEATSIKGVKGQASVQEVVEAVMAAEQTLQAGIAIRDKVVSAYLEISRMAI
jgi:flagellar hook-basal body complex protein FliE